MATAPLPKKRTTPARRKPVLVPTPGRFGPWGGRYVPETLMAALDELEREYERAKRDPKFRARLSELLKTYAGRPTPLFFARRLTQQLGGGKIYLKREDLLHTGAHKINNCLGQALLVERMGKHRVVAETGAGQHGVATATVCALLGFECVVYMGTEDMRRQELNVFRMRLLGAEVRGVDSGSRTLKDAINEAMRDWVTNVRTTHYLLGSVLGAHPYPTMVRDFHKIIGREAKAQIMKAEGKLPATKPVSPHTFRHTAAVHLLESGVEVNVIRSWLGHTSLETTNRYAEITASLKAAALQACEPPTGDTDSSRRKVVWQDDETLLAWLESL